MASFLTKVRWDFIEKYLHFGTDAYECELVHLENEE